MTTQTPSAPALSFHNQQFSIITHRNGQPWLRLPQIGAALGYTNQYHAQKLYQKHAAEFTDSMTALVKLNTAGGPQEVRIFSLRGAHLLGMFARTERAAEFRRWVLDILDAQSEAEAKRRLQAPARPRIDVRKTMLSNNITPTVPLPTDIQTAVNRRAWVMAHDAYELCRQHLARRVAAHCEYGHPERKIDRHKAVSVIAETSLDMALTPAHYNAMASVLRMAQMVADHAAQNVAELYDELNGSIR